MANNIKEVRDRLEWDSTIESLPTSNIYLTWTWGEYKIRKGWSVFRLKVIDENSGKTIGVCQLQSKKKGFLTLFFMQGGVRLIDICDEGPKYEKSIKLVRTFIADLASHWLFFVDFNAHEIPLAKMELLKFGFSPVLNNGMFTFLIDCDLDPSEKMLSGNWRHNLKRAVNNDQLKMRMVQTKIDRIAAMRNLSLMYGGLLKRKLFSASIDTELISDLVVDDNNITIFEALLDGQVVAMRLVYVCSDHVFDFLACSNDSAKNCYANYLLMWHAIVLSRKLGKRFFDTGGVNPAKNVGVFNFKKGIGGRFVQNGPMWLASSNKYIGMFARMALACSE